MILFVFTDDDERPVKKAHALTQLLYIFFYKNTPQKSYSLSLNF